MKKENISFDGERSAEILLGRDTRPSGESLMEAAKQVRIPFNYHLTSVCFGRLKFIKSYYYFD